MRNRVVVSKETCTGCGLCSQVCSKKILKMNHRKVEVVDYPDWGCCQCGLCMSVCPTRSIQVAGLNYDEFVALPEDEVDIEALEGMLSSRRSIRRFEDRSVERGVLDQVLRVSAMTPVGSPPSSVQVLVLDEKEYLDELFQDTVRCWKKLTQSMKNPIYRFVSRRIAGASQYHALTSHALPSARVCCENADNGKNIFTFDAPAIIFFHGHKLGVCVVENCWLAASYATIAARALGLGSTFSGMIPPIVNMNGGVKRKLGIPEENDIHSCLMLGYPAVKFKRKIPREHKDVRYLTQSETQRVRERCQ
ncbi:MAG: 4Fe-4S dicluster domain-containing protein [Ardenticatenales bacterium]|nr:4Fe-4S dicluster domain-containing protein [Ardenticatenales bacterium]